jgi:hypothetical protein
MKTFRLLLALSLITVPLQADEQVRAVQEELRRRNLYFGDVDGRRTPELEQATKRYQARKGFATNGVEDRDTLRSLGLLPRTADEAPPKELKWPEEPVLKSDAKIDVAGEARELAAETGVAPSSIAPPTVAGSGPRRNKTTAAVKPVRAADRPSKGDQQVDASEAGDFVRRYLRAMSRNDVREELEFYADRVNYYANGEVDRRIVERTLKRYYQRWPSRSYSLGKVVGYSMVPGRGEIVITCRVKFTLKSHGKTVRGETDNRFTINAATADPRIVAIEEHRVRR